MCIDGHQEKNTYTNFAIVLETKTKDFVWQCQVTLR